VGVPSRELTEREREILTFLLEADFQGAPELRVQAQSAKVAGMCKCGCATIDLEVDRDRSPRAELSSRVPIQTSPRPETPVEDGLVSLILWTEDGWLSGVEISFISDEPPREFPPPQMFESP
jgi:hypothetical protein